MPVDIKDYPPNSDSSKQTGSHDYTKPKIEGKVSIKKTSEASKRIRSSAKEIEKYTIEEVLLPGLKNAVWDIITTGLDILLYGESTPGSRHGRNDFKRPATSLVNYASTSNMRGMGQARRTNVNRVKARPEDDIIFERKADADMVLDGLREAIENFGTVSVQTLFDMCDKTAPWTANKYGWMDLEDAYVERTRDGYILKMPRSLPLE